MFIKLLCIAGETDDVRARVLVAWPRPRASAGAGRGGGQRSPLRIHTTEFLQPSLPLLLAVTILANVEILAANRYNPPVICVESLTLF